MEFTEDCAAFPWNVMCCFEGTTIARAIVLRWFVHNVGRYVLVTVVVFLIVDGDDAFVFE